MEHTLQSFVQKYGSPLSIVAAGAFIAFALLWAPPRATPASADALAESVLPSDGVVLPITWGDLGARLVKEGVIDAKKLESLYTSRGGFPKEYRDLIENHPNDRIVINNWNANYLLNLLWALGLGNENPVLTDKTGMMNPQYGGAGNFASTGGWTLAVGNAMAHYNTHHLITLTKEQQALVDRVSAGIYRPCCGNSTHFPDCNHGMAMLGLLELMASQGVSEEDMYKAALAVNSYWFPDTYLTIATYKAQQGIAWKDVSPGEVLGAAYSSGQGFANIRSKVVQPSSAGGGGSCSA